MIAVYDSAELLVNHGICQLHIRANTNRSHHLYVVSPINNKKQVAFSKENMVAVMSIPVSYWDGPRENPAEVRSTAHPDWKNTSSFSYS